MLNQNYTDSGIPHQFSQNQKGSSLYDAILFGFQHAKVLCVTDYRRFGGIIGNIHPSTARCIGLWGSRALKAFHSRPDRAVRIANVECYSRKARQFVLMKDKLRPIGELVLSELRRRTFVELYERLNVVK